jgi:hypothetical protein
MEGNVKDLLATRRGTAATRPSVRMVGRVSNLEGSGLGSGCGGSVETRAFPETPNLSEKEEEEEEIGNLVVTRPCWW